MKGKVKTGRSHVLRKDIKKWLMRVGVNGPDIEEIEEQIDREFKRRGIKPCVYHFTENIEQFRAVTILEYLSPSYSHARRALDASLLHHYCLNPATELLNALRRQGLWGVAICDLRDTFSRQEGRCRAKRRLLRHLKERG